MLVAELVAASGKTGQVVYRSWWREQGVDVGGQVCWRKGEEEVSEGES